MTITEHPEIALDRVTDESAPDARRPSSAGPPRRRRRRLIAGTVLLSGIAIVAANVSLHRLESRPQVERPESETERVPSGSLFDAPLVVRRASERVPSGSLFDAPLVVPRASERVPSGSLFDAPLVVRR